MKALLDTNIFLEIILSQERAGEAKSLLLKSASHEFFITDYSLHSIGLLLFPRNQHEAFRAFLEDILLNGGVGLLTLLPDEMETMIASSQNFRLDFDDAYQYAVAISRDAVLVSFVSDFQRTDRGYKTPLEILQSMT